MCGRYARYGNVKVYLDEFDCRTNPVEFADLFPPRYNIPPTTEVPVIRQTDKGRQISPMRWGLLPSWTKDPKRAPLLNNARAETVADKPSFRSAFKSRRCIIPADGFYEWKKNGKLKLPFYFRRADGRPIAFAGLWERWNDLESCTIITTEANELMSSIHDRMPVILGRNDYTAWLDPTATETDKLLAPCPPNELICDPVDTVVNNVRNEGPQCIVPLNSA